MHFPRYGAGGDNEIFKPVSESETKKCGKVNKNGSTRDVRRKGLKERSVMWKTVWKTVPSLAIRRIRDRQMKRKNTR